MASSISDQFVDLFGIDTIFGGFISIQGSICNPGNIYVQHLCALCYTCSLLPCVTLLTSSHYYYYSLRSQSLLYLKLFKMRKAEVKECQRVINDYMQKVATERHTCHSDCSGFASVQKKLMSVDSHATLLSRHNRRQLSNNAVRRCRATALHRHARQLLHQPAVSDPNLRATAVAN